MEYKILIAEDEKHTRNCLEKFVPWADLNISVLDFATDGEEAWNMFSRGSYDLVLTDIRMPRMNGIELCRKIKSANSRIPVIFLSGYSDKEYLFSAISLQVLQYIEKPIDYGEMETVLRQAVAELENTKLESEIRKAGHSDLLYKLCSGESSQDISDSAIKESFPDLDMENNFCCLLLTWLGPEKDAIDANYIIQYFKQRGIALVAAQKSSGEILAVLSSHEANQNRLSQEILAFLKDKSNEFFITLGSSVPTIRNLYQSYSEARKLQDKRFYLNIPAFRRIGPEPPRRFGEGEEALSSFSEIVTEGSKIKLCTFIDNLTIKIRSKEDTEIEMIQDLFINLANILPKADSENAGPIKSDRAEMCWKKITSCRSLDQLLEYLKEETIKHFEKAEKDRQGNQKIRQIKQFIEENLNNPDLSVQAICNTIYLSSEYMSRFFKQQTGESPSQFISSRRIEKAKELLRDPEMKIYEITDSVGLRDSNYFTRIFKKHTGMTPREYRNRQLK
ncbi:MAG: response regulator [Spirochaetales bacterium]|nr:response regulator [Spirochaetales bacterium]